MRAAYYTLGCKVNQYETEAMAELMEAAGYETVDFSEQADFYVINTCTVTSVADKKSRQMIHRAAARGAHVCVCGCMAQKDGEEVLAMAGVSAVLGSSNKSDIVEVAGRLAAGEDKINAVKEIRREKTFEQMEISRPAGRTRGYIKICDGCDNYCSYCIIPYARGPVRSRSLKSIVSEAERLGKSGVKEVVLTGIHVSSYGKDLQNCGFLDVLNALERVEGIARVRLSSLEPTLLTEEFCAEAAKLSRLCPHFHVSLQSGSSSVLKRMNRKYTAREYAGFVANLRKHFDRPALTTDVIVGFPGETEEEHKETLQFLKEVGFSRLHVFPFSKRQGTAAAKMGGEVSAQVKKARAAEVIALGEKLAEEYALSLIGKEEEVLFEEEKEGAAKGYTKRYVMLRAEAPAGSIQKVRITGYRDGCLMGTTVEEEK